MAGKFGSMVVAALSFSLCSGMALAKCGPCEAKSSPCGEKKCGEARIQKTSACGESKCGEVKKTACAPVACGACETKCKTKCPPAVTADIERLKAVNPECSSQLCIKYQVELEHACADDYDLLLQVKCDGNIMWERVVALVDPFDADGNDRKYRGAFNDELGQVFSDRSKLIIEGNVIPRSSHALAAGNGAGTITVTSLDRERERIRKADNDHGYATPLYTTAGIIYTPVRWVAAPTGLVASR